MNTLWQDLRYGTRTLLKNRGFTAVAVLALTLGIGANTALFSVVNGVLLRPLSFNEPERLGQLYEENREHSLFLNSVSGPNFVDWKNQSQVFESMAAYANAAANVTGLDEPERVTTAVVAADFFQTLKVQPLLGRTFPPEDVKPGGPNLVVLSYGFWQRRFGGDANASKQDTAQSPPVTVISDTMARRFWPDENPIGQRITAHDGGPNPREIVGIVGDIKHDGLAAAVIRPAMFAPYVQDPTLSMTLMVRATGDPASLASSVREEIHAVDPDVPVSEVVTLIQLVANSLSRERFSTLLLATFAGLALLLAMVGVYGVMSYTIAQRTHEIGIRMALGANPGDVLRLAAGQGLKPAITGVAVGLVTSIALTRVMTKLLYGVSPTDPVSFAVISLLLTGVALGACLVPARRATKVDPLIALRYE